MTREVALIGLKKVCPVPLEVALVDTILKVIHTV